MALKENYKDDMFEGSRRWRVAQNSDGTSAITDATAYTQKGDKFGANDINETNKAVNSLAQEVSATKKSVSDGKALVAAAITAKRVVTAATATFAEMAANIGKIILGSGNAQPGDVLQGKTATNDTGVEFAGTMPQRGAWAGRIGVNGKATIPEGYHNGGGYVDQIINSFVGIPKPIQNVRLANGRFEVAVDEGYYGCYWENGSYEYLTYAQVANAIGLYASDLRANKTVCGVTGAMQDYSYLAQGQTSF